MHSEYSKPLPGRKPSLLSISLMYLSVLSAALPLFNLGSYLSDEEFSTVAMFYTYAAMAMVMTVLFSIWGITYTKHIILLFFYALMIVSTLFHAYFLQDLSIRNICIYLIGLFFQVIGILVARSKTHVQFIEYRKQHLKYVRELNKR